MVVLTRLYYNIQWICNYYAVSALFLVIIVLTRVRVHLDVTQKESGDHRNAIYFITSQRSITHIPRGPTRVPPNGDAN
jgi:hypothetical protein